MNFASFILSTGRCGTQWIASSLADVYSDRMDVEHEPLHDGYEARKILAHGDSTHPAQAMPPAVLEHLDRIVDRLSTRPYMECGHPNWSTIPYLADRFRGRVRIIHLTRHPVPTCCSWLTHGAFQTPLLPHVPEKLLLSPFDEGTRFREYRQTWEKLSPFERSLYYWSEVNALALDLQSRSDAPWLRLRYEDLFDGDGLERLLEFLELPDRAGIFGQKRKVVDRYQYISGVWQDWRIIENHPRAMAMAQQLGYDLNGIDDMALRRRYLAESI
jgi:hypothetical protein